VQFSTMTIFDRLDETRRWQAGVLDTLGLCPIETPSRVVFTEQGVTVREYVNALDAKPVLVLVPAPIKHAYIWDLSPSVSVVRRCMGHGMRVYLLQWQAPGGHEERFGLTEYAHRLILDSLSVVEAESGRGRVFMAGHSLGGTLAAIFSALHPERIQGLILLGAPLHFGEDAGAFAALLASLPASLPTSVPGNIPGSFLSVVACMACPMTFGWSRWIDGLCSLPDGLARDTYLRVARWMFDEVPLARHFFEEVLELYHEDKLMRGTLIIGGQRVAPMLVTAPLLSVVDRQCHIVPLQSVLRFHEATKSLEKQVLWYYGDIGIGFRHVGTLIGRNAHDSLWPEILQWIDSQSKAA
jgi:polyhydroxyalkanoate synthase